MTRGLGIVGNCSFSALLDRGSVEWLCWPRPDSSFVVGPLLDRDRGGAFVVEGVGTTEVTQEYVENTNVLRTLFSGPDGSFELLDFAPRFALYDRRFKPLMLVRILRPLEGEPRAVVRCNPVYGYGETVAGSWRASNHIQFTDLPAPVRLTTNVPLSYVEEERPFLLERDHHLVLTWGEPLETGLEETAERFLERTVDYWRRWVKGTRTPRDYQREVIRSALVLKLHQYEDTGALLAATTTSLPEHPGSGRNWDYRYCWLRDAYFTLNALERLGHNDEMERFLVFLRNLCEERQGELQPAYTISGGDRAPEQELPWLAGFRGEQPVQDREPGVRARPERRLRGDDPRSQPSLPRCALLRGPGAEDRARPRREPARPDRATARGAGCRPLGATGGDPAAQLQRAHALGGGATCGRGGRCAE